MRLILENSRNKEVSLSDDLMAMEIYVQMEQFRMGRYFSFTVQIEEGIHKDNVLIPPMILQPFIENSIWHGFHQLPYEPVLQLKISREQDQLCLLLRDNGQPSVESPIAPELSSAKKSSLGLILTKERVELLSKTKGGESSVEISDIRNNKNEYLGKQVLIKIPYDDENEPYRRRWTKEINTYATNYNTFDVSLAPLVESVFNANKSQLKVIEAGFHKKALIASDTDPFTLDLLSAVNEGNFNDKGNALLVGTKKNHKDWARHMKRLVENPNMIEDLGNRLYETVKDTYSLKKVCKDRVEFFKSIINK
jgi:glycosyltransferase involved in cell wall biosynthesis